MIVSNYYDFCRLLEENRDKPLTGKQGQRDFDQRDGLWTDEI